MKKALLLLALAIFIGGNASAQQAHRHAISMGPSELLGIAINYEYMLFPNFSMAMEAGISASLSLRAGYNAAIHARWFPVSNSAGRTLGFFVSGGLGFGGIWANEYYVEGVLLSTGVGYKVGAGKRKGFIFTPVLDINFVLGDKTPIGDYYNSGKTEFGFGWFPNLKVLFGIAF